MLVVSTACQSRVSVRHLQVLTSRPISGVNRKLQLKPIAWQTTDLADPLSQQITSAQLVLKWGGELTDFGVSLAEVRLLR